MDGVPRPRFLRVGVLVWNAEAFEAVLRARSSSLSDFQLLPKAAAARDRAGLGALIEMQRKTKAKGGGLKLCHLRPNLRQALEMARLLPIFETCASETAAVASF